MKLERITRIKIEENKKIIRKISIKKHFEEFHPSTIEIAKYRREIKHYKLGGPYKTLRIKNNKIQLINEYTFWRD
jgi:hypothetical protein